MVLAVAGGAITLFWVRKKLACMCTRMFGRAPRTHRPAWLPACAQRSAGQGRGPRLTSSCGCRGTAGAPALSPVFSCFFANLAASYVTTAILAYKTCSACHTVSPARALQRRGGTQPLSPPATAWPRAHHYQASNVAAASGPHCRAPIGTYAPDARTHCDGPHARGRKLLCPLGRADLSSPVYGRLSRRACPRTASPCTPWGGGRPPEGP